MAETGAPFGAYVHIPFCASKCEYCAFATWTDRAHLIEAYLAALRAEIERAVAAGLPSASTIFVGAPLTAAVLTSASVSLGKHEPP